jgi:hypothetical protein
MDQVRQAAERRSLGFAAAAVFNFIIMLSINAHPVWRPWLNGVVTEEFADVLFALNVAFVVRIFGNLILSVRSPPALERFLGLAFSITAFIAVAVFYRSYPLNLSRFGEPLDGLTRVFFFLVVAAASTAFLVNLVRYSSADESEGTLVNQ